MSWLSPSLEPATSSSASSADAERNAQKRSNTIGNAGAHCISVAVIPWTAAASSDWPSVVGHTTVANFAPVLATTAAISTISQVEVSRPAQNSACTRTWIARVVAQSLNQACRLKIKKDAKQGLVRQQVRRQRAKDIEMHSATLPSSAERLAQSASSLVRKLRSGGDRTSATASRRPTALRTAPPNHHMRTKR